MAEMICENCRGWIYDRYTEENYGMGVGICQYDGSERFCSHPCPLCDEDKNE